MDLRIWNERLRLPLDATEEQALAKLSEVVLEADSAKVWRVRAEENLEKMEINAKVARENDELKAEAYLAAAKSSYKITAAEEIPLKEMYLSGPAGRATVAKLVAARGEKEYMTRMQSLRDVREAPTDAIAEVEALAAELMAKNETFRGKPGAAQLEVLKKNPSLSARYREATITGLGGES